MASSSRRARRFRLITRGAVIRILALLVILLAVAVGLLKFMTAMPGESWTGPLPDVTEEQRILAAQLEHDLVTLADDIGERNVFRPDAYREAERWITAQLTQAGYEVETQRFSADAFAGGDGTYECANIIAERSGGNRADEIIVIGAHYDTVPNCPGANDNGTGVVATIALARAFADASPQCTLRFVLFANEEPPFFQTDQMGSLVYARSCRERGDNIIGMISLETMGCFFDAPGSQRYPPPMGSL